DFVASSKNLMQFASASRRMRPDDLTRISSLYDAGLRHTDNVLAEIFEGLTERGLMNDTYVILTSDHGEEFGDHGGLLHRDLLYDELLRVPLIVLGPDIEPSRRNGLASTVDIVPTALGLLGVQTEMPLEGNDLLALEPDQPSYTISQYGPSRYAVSTSKWKLIESVPRKTELYDLQTDPREAFDIQSDQEEQVQELRQILRRWLRKERQTHSTSASQDLSVEEINRLEALGYIN
ncbi:MAG: sulfatase-like hydrolase/transferase, partial [Acidobacteriota bacterium]